MLFNPDQAKQLQEVIFWRKTSKIVHSPRYVYSVIVKVTQTQKHRGLQVDKKLLFIEHTNNKNSKVTQAIWFLRKLQAILSHIDHF